MKPIRTVRNAWALGVLTLLLVAPLTLTLQGCTDLDEEVFGAVTADNFYRTDAEVMASLAPVYATLRGTLWGYHNLSQVSSDETIVPTRGSDWYDGGTWLSIHRQTWTPSLGDLNGAWVDAYTGIARANVVLQTLENSDVNNKAQIFAELRALRAFYYYQLMDLFGGVPIVGDDEFTVDPKNPPKRETRQKVFEFIESELVAARADLPAKWDGGYGRMTKGAVDVMLANMYLNAGVFSKDSGINANGPNPCPAAMCQKAVQKADELLNSGQYSLIADWFKNFSADNSQSAEHIFVVPHLAENGLGVNFLMRALHYSQFTPSPWNGFSTLAETYNTFDKKDKRTGIFLIGQAYNLETGKPVNNRQGEPLVFTPEIKNADNASEGEGVRILKFPHDPNHKGADNGNDYPYFRLGEVYLIKAEALNELNGPNQTSIDLLNTLRQRVYNAADYVPLRLADFASKEALRDRILKERLFELTYEAKRRQDLIRHGKFTQPWAFKSKTEDFRVLFPVPQTQRDANPNLTQNPGY